MEEEKINKEKTKQMLLKAGWILFIVLLALVVGFLLYPKIVNAVEWPLNKTQTCVFFNISGESCNQYWCNTFLNCSYNVNDSICLCNTIINNTIYINVTQNYTIYVNVTSNSTNMSSEEWKGYVDNLTRELRDNLVDRIENETKPDYYAPPTTEPWPWYAWFLIALVVMGGIIIMSMNYAKQNMNKPIVKTLTRGFKNISQFKVKKEEKPKIDEEQKEIEEDEEEDYREVNEE